MTSNHENPNNKQFSKSRQAAAGAFHQSLEELREILEQGQQQINTVAQSNHDHPASTEMKSEDWDRVGDDLGSFFEDEELP